MKLTKYICAVLCGLLLVACNSNEPNNPNSGKQGKLDEMAVMQFVPYTKGQTVVFNNQGHGIMVKYTVTDVAQTRTDSTLQVTAKMKGVDFDGVDYYNLEVSAVCTNKKQIDVSLTYAFKMDESHVYVQSGTYHFIDTNDTGEFPQTITLSNKEGINVAQLISQQGVQYYLDNDQVKLTLYQGVINF